VEDESHLATPLERVFSRLQTKALAKRRRACGVGGVCTVWQPDVVNTTADGDAPSPLAGWGKTPWPGGEGAGRKRDPRGHPRLPATRSTMRGRQVRTGEDERK
jgi:hypothetical protein